MVFVIGSDAPVEGWKLTVNCVLGVAVVGSPTIMTICALGSSMVPDVAVPVTELIFCPMHHAWVVCAVAAVQSNRLPAPSPAWRFEL